MTRITPTISNGSFLTCKDTAIRPRHVSLRPSGRPIQTEECTNKNSCCHFSCLRCYGLTLFHLDAVMSTVRNATVQWLERSSSPPHGPRGVDPGYSVKRPVANSEAESGSGCLTPAFRPPADLENPSARPSGPPARNYFTPTVSPGSGRLTKYSGLASCFRMVGIISA